MFKLVIILSAVLACYGQNEEVVSSPTPSTDPTDEPVADVEPTTTVEPTTEEPVILTTLPTIDLCSYFLYTRTNPQTPVSVFANAESISNSGISASRKTVLVVHGHRGSGFSTLNPMVKDALLTAEDVNVIVVDWALHASLSYSVAVSSVPLIADSVANFITQLVSAQVATLNIIHIVGFDLGAHVAGIAGRSLYTVARITGLDPSGSQWGANSARLKITDASYVEVIHTDGNGLLANGLGVAIGQVDFFANGGGSQPGCVTHACCHNRAYELFAASMINANLVGYPCSSTVQLNLNLCRGIPLRMGTNELRKIGYGIYRINTRRSFPF